MLLLKLNNKTLISYSRGHFEGGTRGNAVPIVEKLPERMGTA